MPHISMKILYTIVLGNDHEQVKVTSENTVELNRLIYEACKQGYRHLETYTSDYIEKAEEHPLFKSGKLKAEEILSKLSASDKELLSKYYRGEL